MVVNTAADDWVDKGQSPGTDLFCGSVATDCPLQLDALAMPFKQHKHLLLNALKHSTEAELLKKVFFLLWLCQTSFHVNL